MESSEESEIRASSEDLPKSKTPIVPEWAILWRSRSRYFMFLGLKIIGVCMLALPFVVATFPRGSMLGKIIAICFVLGLAMSLFGIGLRFVVLALGYSRFSLKLMLGITLILAVGGSFLANEMVTAGLIIIFAVFFAVMLAVQLRLVLWLPGLPRQANLSQRLRTLRRRRRS